MEKYWRPGLRVWWRRDGEAQLGVDPPHLVFGLSRAEHNLLDAFARADPQLDCWTVARRLGWERHAVEAFLDRLPEFAVVDSPSVQPTPTGRYWSMVELTGANYTTARGTSRVLIDGLDSLGLALADAVCLAGVDSLHLYDDSPVLPQDVQPGGFITDDVGQPRALASLHRLRPRHPMARIHVGAHPAYPSYRPHLVAPDGVQHGGDPHSGEEREQTGGSGPAGGAQGSGSPAGGAPARVAAPVYAPGLVVAHPEITELPAGVDVVVVVGNGAIDPLRVNRYAWQNTPVLPLTVRELDIMIGPLLEPAGPCLRCVHLTLTDADPRWPALATQLVTENHPGMDPIVVEMARALGAHQVVAFADGRPTAISQTSLHVDGIHPIPRYREWSVHPNCGCQVQHLAGRAGA